ncbi:MAG: SWIM zinc finger family protein, partial [Planctomycetota bacterium]
MPLSLEQVVEMAPDAGSAAAGKQLMAAKNWDALGQSPEAVWGLCRGSAVYQVKVELSSLGYHCSCPSRKFPCKHVLGLLMLFAATPDALAPDAAPEWVGEWLARRAKRQEQKAERQEEQAKKPVDEKAQQRRAEKREANVADGLARLDVWMKDLVRGGLATVEAKPPSFWDDQAKRLVDAQAPGLASRVARLGLIPRTSHDWPARLLAEMGRIKLLLHAWQRIDSLDTLLKQDIRQILGWTVNQAELEREGEQVEDTWVVVGQWVDNDD